MLDRLDVVPFRKNNQERRKIDSDMKLWRSSLSIRAGYDRLTHFKVVEGTLFSLFEWTLLSKALFEFKKSDRFAPFKKLDDDVDSLIPV
jgi:hypothetical protein